MLYKESSGVRGPSSSLHLVQLKSSGSSFLYPTPSVLCAFAGRQNQSLLSNLIAVPTVEIRLVTHALSHRPSIVSTTPPSGHQSARRSLWSRGSSSTALYSTVFPTFECLRMIPPQSLRVAGASNQTLFRGHFPPYLCLFRNWHCPFSDRFLSPFFRPCFHLERVSPTEKAVCLSTHLP